LFLPCVLALMLLPFELLVGKSFWVSQVSLRDTRKQKTKNSHLRCRRHKGTKSLRSTTHRDSRRKRSLNAQESNPKKNFVSTTRRETFVSCLPAPKCNEGRRGVLVASFFYFLIWGMSTTSFLDSRFFMLYIIFSPRSFLFLSSHIMATQKLFVSQVVTKTFLRKELASREKRLRVCIDKLEDQMSRLEDRIARLDPLSRTRSRNGNAEMRTRSKALGAKGTGDLTNQNVTWQSRNPSTDKL